MKAISLVYSATPFHHAPTSQAHPQWVTTSELLKHYSSVPFITSCLLLSGVSETYFCLNWVISFASQTDIVGSLHSETSIGKQGFRILCSLSSTNTPETIDCFNLDQAQLNKILMHPRRTMFNIREDKAASETRLSQVPFPHTAFPLFVFKVVSLPNVRLEIRTPSRMYYQLSQPDTSSHRSFREEGVKCGRGIFTELTSLPFVAPPSVHSTETQDFSKFTVLTLALWIMPRV